MDNHNDSMVIDPLCAPVTIEGSAIEYATTAANQANLPSASQWHAFLTLSMVRNARGVVLQRCQHQGPLYVQKAFYPEGPDCAHIYLLHPPGGMVSGDRLTITCQQTPQTHTLITTPGAGRVYKARPDKSLQHQMIALHVANDSMMEWLPQETLLYPNAQTRLDTTVYLQGNARFIGWDITCFGLNASQQPFDKGQVNQCFQIHRDDNIVLRERLIINDQYRALLETTTGLQGRSVNGFMVAGPFKHIDIDDLLQSLRALSLESSTLIGISLVGDFLTIRSLGVDSEQTKHFFIQCWQHIRPQLLNRPACIPRIWAT